jgi:hypothetical protein
MQKIKDWFKKTFTKENMKQVFSWTVKIVLVFGIIQVILKLFRDIGEVKEKLEEKEIPVLTYPEKKKEADEVQIQVDEDKKEVEKVIESNETIIDATEKVQQQVYYNEKEREALEKKLFN